MSLPRHPLEVLPDVVWRKVIKKLCAQDCHSLNNSCNYFRDVAKPSAFWWNFHKILPLIVGNGVDTGAHKVAFRLNRNDLLNCRLVCQAWRSAIEGYILRCQNSHVPKYSPFSDKDKQMGPDFSIRFNGENQIDRLMIDLEEYPLSYNFVWKNIELGYIREDPFDEPTEEEVDSFWEKAYLLFQTIGPNISRIYIDGINYISVDGGLALTKIVQRSLTLLPNLYQLCVTHEEPEQGTGEYDVFKNEIPEINQYFANNPLPRLPHLKTLVIWECVTPLPISLIKHLTMSYGPQLESLKANCVDVIPRQLNFEILENLKDLEVVTFELGLEEHDPTDLNFLDNLNCPLKTLRLKIDELEEMSVTNFLEKIQNLPIQEIDIKFKMSYVPVPALRLPNINSLSLEVSNWRNPEVSFDLLVCCPNLEHLQFTWKHDSPLPLIGDEQRIHLNEIFNNDGSLYDSNIWDVLPKLETFTYVKIRWTERHRVVRKRIFTRQNVNSKEFIESQVKTLCIGM